MQEMRHAHIVIPSIYEHTHDKVHDLSTYAHDAQHLHITIAAQSHIVLHDTGTWHVESLDLTLEPCAQVFLVSQCLHKLISVSCHEKSYFSCAQVWGLQDACWDAQTFRICMQGAGAKAYVRIMPLLHQESYVCFTEQIHAASHTSSDVQIGGAIYGAGSFGNTSRIIVPAGMKDVQIIQKSFILNAHEQAQVSAQPCFDVQSKDVRCTHGAAIGFLDENQLWYLQSRGLNRKDSLFLLPRVRCLADLDPALPVSAKKLVCALIGLESSAFL